MHQSTHILFHLSNHPYTHPQPTHPSVSSTHIFIHPYSSFPPSLLPPFFPPPPPRPINPSIHPDTYQPIRSPTILPLSKILPGHPPPFIIPPLSNILPGHTSTHHSTHPQPLTHFLPPVRPPNIRHLPSLPSSKPPSLPPTHSTRLSTHCHHLPSASLPPSSRSPSRSTTQPPSHSHTPVCPPTHPNPHK